MINERMKDVVGFDMDDYFFMLLNCVCCGFGIKEIICLIINNIFEFEIVVYFLGFYVDCFSKKFQNDNWYWDDFMFVIEEYYKG